MTEGASGLDRTILIREYEKLVANPCSLNLARGKPNSAMTALADGLLSIDTPSIVDGVDIRNYGAPLGLDSARELAGDITDCSPENTAIVSNGSMMVIQTVLNMLWFKGHVAAPALKNLQHPKFLCTLPGYDRHFKLLEHMGIQMVGVPEHQDGPNTNTVQRLLEADDSICGLICVPRHANPTGAIWSESIIREIMQLSKNRPNGFSLLFDHAYALHDIVDDIPKTPPLLHTAMEEGCEDNTFIFGSTSKLALPGSGMGWVTMSDDNLKRYSKMLEGMTVGSDKVQQAKQVAFFKSQGGVRAFYQEQFRPLLSHNLNTAMDCVQRLTHSLALKTSTFSMTKPRGGFFISLKLLQARAVRTVQLAANAGLILTPAGATHPHGIDNADAYIRLATTALTDEADIEKAFLILAICGSVSSEELVERNKLVG